MFNCIFSDSKVMLIYQQLVSVMESRISAAAWLDEKSLNELMKKLRSMSIQLPEMFSGSQLSDSLREVIIVYS